MIDNSHDGQPNPYVPLGEAFQNAADQHAEDLEQSYVEAAGQGNEHLHEVYSPELKAEQDKAVNTTHKDPAQAEQARQTAVDDFRQLLTAESNRTAYNKLDQIDSYDYFGGDVLAPAEKELPAPVPAKAPDPIKAVEPIISPPVEAEPTNELEDKVKTAEIRANLVELGEELAQEMGRVGADDAKINELWAEARQFIAEGAQMNGIGITAAQDNYMKRVLKRVAQIRQERIAKEEDDALSAAVQRAVDRTLQSRQAQPATPVDDIQVPPPLRVWLGDDDAKTPASTSTPLFGFGARNLAPVTDTPKTAGLVVELDDEEAPRPADLVVELDDEEPQPEPLRILWDDEYEYAPKPAKKDPWYYRALDRINDSFDRFMDRRNVPQEQRGAQAMWIGLLGATATANVVEYLYNNGLDAAQPSTTSISLLAIAASLPLVVRHNKDKLKNNSEERV